MYSVLILETKAQLPLFAFTLNIGQWKTVFTEDQYKVLIAESLNQTVCQEQYKYTLVGYLINRQRVCLILRIKPNLVQKMLNFFYDSVRKNIRKHLEEINKTFLKKWLKQNGIDIEDLFNDLFEQRPLRNENLVRLITGRKVVLPYYNPHLRKLKDQIRNYNFCSAIDYSGAKSPVLVTLLSKFK
ncbi:MAG TPA: hypothetical protein VFJ43_14720 [Bacteroidia bacterium]|nr:hypothetical protein [Bacteroidia bacterium]